MATLRRFACGIVDVGGTFSLVRLWWLWSVRGCWLVRWLCGSWAGCQRWLIRFRVVVGEVDRGFVRSNTVRDLGICGVGWVL